MQRKVEQRGNSELSRIHILSKLNSIFPLTSRSKKNLKGSIFRLLLFDVVFVRRDFQDKKKFVSDQTTSL